ncbi:hypothetical protein EGW08_004638 [Elysia chlorotica]|uniref:Apple domain-containing protein n=1 Tax=Elysia chlorotica TaxID=188477 RepID=A0A433U188_ELYCH|nr:hypothetical protein EGW08_004638 [Elysia chlorotica]
MAFLECNDQCRQTKFRGTSGRKVVSAADHLSSMSRSGMSNIICAAYCRRNINCDLYHYSTVHNVCETFKKTSGFNVIDDLTADPNWSSWIEIGTWTLVFRSQSRIGVSTYETWIDSAHQDDNPYPSDFPAACLGLSLYDNCDRHFRSRVLDNWVNIKEVYFSLVKDDVEVVRILFDGQGTDRMSWFSQSRILDSSWSELATDAKLEPVMISG